MPSHDEIAHRSQQARRKLRHALRPDPGTTRTHPTLRKGIVTDISPLRVDTQGDGLGLPARNLTGTPLADGQVVWLLVDAGRRLVVGTPTETAPVRAANNTSTAVALTDSYKNLVTVTVDIPADWQSWHCDISGTVQINPGTSPTSSRNGLIRAVHDGTQVAQSMGGLVGAANFTGLAVTAGTSSPRTGTGNQTFAIQGRLTVNDDYDAVKTSIVVACTRAS